MFIEALATIISGGGGNDQTPIRIYTSASRLESFMRGCNQTMRVGDGSRLPLIDALERADQDGDQTILRNIIERAADPRDFASKPGPNGLRIGLLQDSRQQTFLGSVGVSQMCQQATEVTIECAN